MTSPDQWKPYLGGGILSILMMMALGIPIYVCASASVPIAAGLIHLGASPGAALAFLDCRARHRTPPRLRRSGNCSAGGPSFLYLVTIAISAVGAGLALDWLHAHRAVHRARLGEQSATTPRAAIGFRRSGQFSCWQCLAFFLCRRLSSQEGGSHAMNIPNADSSSASPNESS